MAKVERILGRYFQESDFTKKDLKYIKSVNLTDYSRDKIYKLLDSNLRQKIHRRIKKGYDAMLISTDLNIDFSLVRQFIKQLNASKIIDGKKYCIGCDTYKTINKFWKCGKRRSTRCAICLNEERNEKREKYPEWRKKTLESQSKSYHKNKEKNKRLNSELSLEKINNRRQIANKSYKKISTRIMNDKIIKHRLLNN